MFQTDFRIPPERQAGVLQLRACLHRTTSAEKPESGKARDKGARLTWSEWHQLSFEQRRTKGGMIDVVWTDFSGMADIKGLFPSSMFCLELNHPQPVLHLNRGSDHLQVLFDAREGTKEARERDVAFAQIATSVWAELLESALMDLEATLDGDTQAPAVIEEISEWQQSVIRDWTPELFPELPPEASLEVLLENLGDKALFRELVASRVPMAVQQRMKLRDQLEGFANRVLADG